MAFNLFWDKYLRVFFFFGREEWLQISILSLFVPLLSPSPPNIYIYIYGIGFVCNFKMSGSYWPCFYVPQKVNLLLCFISHSLQMVPYTMSTINVTIPLWYICQLVLFLSIFYPKLLLIFSPFTLLYWSFLELPCLELMAVNVYSFEGWH